MSFHCLWLSRCFLVLLRTLASQWGEVAISGQCARNEVTYSLQSRRVVLLWSCIFLASQTTLLLGTCGPGGGATGSGSFHQTCFSSHGTNQMRSAGEKSELSSLSTLGFIPELSSRSTLGFIPQHRVISAIRTQHAVSRLWSCIHQTDTGPHFMKKQHCKDSSVSPVALCMSCSSGILCRPSLLAYSSTEWTRASRVDCPANLTVRRGLQQLWPLLSSPACGPQTV